MVVAVDSDEKRILLCVFCLSSLRVFLSNVVCVVELFIIDCPFDFLWRLTIMSLIVGIQDY